VIVLGLTLAFYMWTAASSVPISFPTKSDGTYQDVYNQLTSAFLHGHTALAVKVPAGLLRLGNPYNPAENAPYQAAFHDYSFYKGHLYSSWGPTPALTLFLAVRLTGRMMSDSFAVAFYMFAGLVCAVALLHLLVRRFLPGTPNWMLVVATAGLAVTNVGPFLLRRPWQYEVAISSGYCFEMAGLLLMASAALAPRVRRWRLACGSLCLGLAVGGRPDLAAGGIVAVAVVAYLIRRRREPLAIAAFGLGPILVCAALLAAYNYVRFNSVTEFGVSYSLASFDVRGMPSDQLSYVPPGVFSYLLLPPTVELTFPHVFLRTDTAYPFSLPRLYTGGAAGWPAEPTGGLLPTMPVTLLLLALPVLFWRFRGTDRQALVVAGGFTILGLAVVGLLSYAIWGTTQRYEVDYATFFLLAAFVVWAVLLGRSRPKSIRRRITAVVGSVLTTVGAAIGIALSFNGYLNFLYSNHPGTYRTLEDVTSPVATLVTMVNERPALVRVDGPSPLGPYGRGNFGGPTAPRMSLGEGKVTITILSPGVERAELLATVSRGLQPPSTGPVPILVLSTGQPPRLVPVSRGPLRLPIRLNWGLNRITLDTLVPDPVAPPQLYLDDLSLRS
jgi:hypothetical protein